MKKINLLGIIFICYFFNASGQELNLPGNQYHLYGPNSSWNEYLQIGGNGRVTNHAFVAATNGNLHLDSKAGFATYINHYNYGNTYINSQGGRVGIGTYTPGEKLDVSGNIKASRFRTETAIFKENSRSSFDSFNSGLDNALYPGWIATDFGGTDNASDRLVVGTGYSGRVIIGTHNYNLTNWGGDILINPVGNGNVAIGTTMAREKLSVNGKIRAHEVKVEITGWPDYVFKPEYQLNSLSEVEKFIKENGHLPGVPSAITVETKGLELGEMNKLLLKKVEELTLHLIEQNQKNKQQDLKIEKLMDELKIRHKTSKAKN